MAEVPVGRGQDTDVGVVHAGAPDSTDLATLQAPQQLDLSAHRQLADLIQEQRSTVCRMEGSIFSVFCVRKCALLVPKQLTLKEITLDRPAFTATNGPDARMLCS